MAWQGAERGEREGGGDETAEARAAVRVVNGTISSDAAPVIGSG